MNVIKAILKGLGVAFIILVVLGTVGIRLLFLAIPQPTIDVPIQSSADMHRVTGVELPEIKMTDSRFFIMEAFSTCDAEYEFVEGVSYDDIARPMRKAMQEYDPENIMGHWSEDEKSFVYTDSYALDVTISKTAPYTIKLHYYVRHRI